MVASTPFDFAQGRLSRNLCGGIDEMLYLAALNKDLQTVWQLLPVDPSETQGSAERASRFDMRASNGRVWIISSPFQVEGSELSAASHALWPYKTLLEGIESRIENH